MIKDKKKFISIKNSKFLYLKAFCNFKNPKFKKFYFINPENIY